MDENSGKKESVEGTVTARTCECCGHHELGMMTENGDFIRLRPGMKIKITEKK